MQAVERCGRSQLELRVDPVIGIPRWNFECAVGCREREGAPCGWLLSEHESDSAAIRAGFSIGDVVNLKNDVGAGLDELGLARLEHLGWLSGSKADQEVARKRAGIFLLVSFFL